METPEELLRMLEYPELYKNQQGRGFYDCEIHVKIYAKQELTKHINFPHIEEYKTELNDYACKYCGTGFNVSDYRAMKNHMLNETMCIRGFKEGNECICGRKCGTIEAARTHWYYNCFYFHKKAEWDKKQKEKKEAEEKEKKEKEKEEKRKRKEEERKKKREEEKEEKKKAREQNKRKCELCNVVFRGKKEEERHLNGKFHKLKVQPNVLSCSHCEMTFVRQKHLDDHLLTKKHLRKIQECPSSSLPKNVCASS